MSGYLTNVNLNKNEKIRVTTASEKSGMRVEYRDHPKPVEFCDFDFDNGYNPDAFVGVYGSIFSYEGDVDHGPFWREYDKLC